MSILSHRQPKLNQEPPCCSPAEADPCRSCLSAADLESIIRVGHTGDAAVPGRIAADETYRPETVEDRIRSLAYDLEADHGGNAADFAWGAYRADYRHLWGLYIDTLQRLEMARSEFWPDECPELPPSSYYDPAGDDDLVGATADAELASTES